MSPAFQWSLRKKPEEASHSTVVSKRDQDVERRGEMKLHKKAKTFLPHEGSVESDLGPVWI